MSFSTSVAIVPLLLAVAPLSGQTQWVGGGFENTFSDPINWTQGVPTRTLQGVIGPESTVLLKQFNIYGVSIIQSGGVVTDPSGALRDSRWTMEGGTFRADGFYFLDEGTTFTLNGGEAYFQQKLSLGKTSPGHLRVAGGRCHVEESLEIAANSSLILTGGAVYVGRTLAFYAGNAKLVVTGGRLEASEFSIINDSSFIIGGDAVVTINDSRVGGGGLSPTGSSVLDFRASSPQASLTFNGGPRISYRSMWDNDRLLLNGQSKSDLNGLSFHSTQFRVSGTNGETLSVVPEPAAAGFVAGALLGLTLWRRRS